MAHVSLSVRIRLERPTWLGGHLGGLADLGEIRREALWALQDIAIGEIIASDQEQTLSVNVRNENDLPVYSATITISERWGSDGNSMASSGR
ncbi:DUF6894 family protein [Mesorhizobium sp. WSM4935]|uniref:DUF6894 family protein n=1 Tax=Mesorhizobium sp. WSM4935 TaxID=3038547 RepID=UPI003FA60802